MVNTGRSTSGQDYIEHLLQNLAYKLSYIADMEGLLLMVRMLLPLLLIITFRQDVAAGLTITKVTVPRSIAVGESLWLQCEFVTHGDSVYALKWYLGLEEFYRWTPAETPSVKTFAVRGNNLVVDAEQSNGGRVKVEEVKLGAAGIVRCEVSAEAPSFHTESKVAKLNVIDLPDGKPLMTGVEPAYQLHQEVTVNCSSLRSYPPASLSFYVNDEPADPTWITHYPPIEEEGELQTSVLGLQFPLSARLLEQGRAMVKCVAAIEDRYWETSVATIHSDVPHQASVMEGRASSTSAAPDCLVSEAWLVGGVASWVLLLRRLRH